VPILAKNVTEISLGAARRKVGDKELRFPHVIRWGSSKGDLQTLASNMISIQTTLRMGSLSRLDEIDETKAAGIPILCKDKRQRQVFTY